LSFFQRSGFFLFHGWIAMLGRSSSSFCCKA
jgi:hypothetical protein